MAAIKTSAIRLQPHTQTLIICKWLIKGTARATTPSMVKISTISFQVDKIPLMKSSKCSKIRPRSPRSKLKSASHRNRSLINLRLVSVAHYPYPGPITQYQSSLKLIQTLKGKHLIRLTRLLTPSLVHKAVYIVHKLWPNKWQCNRKRLRRSPHLKLMIILWNYIIYPMDN